MKKKAFVFPGQGAQFVGMGKDLYENSPEAKELFEKANEILGFRITDLMFNGTDEDLKQNQSNPTGDIPSLRDSGQLADRNPGYGSRPLPGRILSPGRCQSFIFRRRITPGTRQSAGDAKSLRSQSFYHGRSDRNGRRKSRSDL